MSLFNELRRRNVIRMAGLYLVGAWLVTQVAATLLPVFGAPAWVMKTVVGVLAIGFLAALVLAWIFELTPAGLKRDEEVPPGDSIAPQIARRMNRMIIAVLAMALAYFAVDKFVLSPRRDATRLAAEPEARGMNAGGMVKSASAERSIAVLPFVNMSPDPENEFFSDGLSEEILNSLVRIDGMQVVARTSSFQFKDRKENLRGIGEKLGVANVLEGSVRREGDRARITAQLIRTSDGYLLWAQTYDRTLQDTLAVQLDIAENVAGALNVLLDDKQRETMRKAGVGNVEAFIAYQKGLKHYFDAHSKPEIDVFEGLRQANVEFDRATTLEPDFFEAHFAKADLHDHVLLAYHRSRAEQLAAQRAALQTLQLAAESSKDEQQRALTLAERQMLSDDWRGLAGSIDAALKAPGCNAFNYMPLFASAFGYADAIETLGRRASACDPLNAINYTTRVVVALANGNGQRALDIQASARKAGVNLAGSLAGRSAQALILLGRADEAGRILDGLPLDQQNETSYIARVLLGRARGESPADVHARLRDVSRRRSKFGQWPAVDAAEAANAGNRAEANRYAAALDARPSGPFLLALYVVACQCGAPFNLEATPHFKARLAESGLRWPPPPTLVLRHAHHGGAHGPER